MYAYNNKVTEISNKGACLPSQTRQGKQTGHKTSKPQHYDRYLHIQYYYEVPAGKVIQKQQNQTNKTNKKPTNMSTVEYTDLQ
jgi:hypothetical protein